MGISQNLGRPFHYWFPHQTWQTTWMIWGSPIVGNPVSLYEEVTTDLLYVFAAKDDGFRTNH